MSDPQPAVTAHLGLDYTVYTDPYPLALHDTGTITLKAKNRSGKPLHCSHITLNVPIGSEAGQLTEQSEALGLKDYDADGWEPYRPDSTSPQSTDIGIASVNHTGGSTRIDDGEEVEFTITDVNVNSTCGSAALTIAEKLTGTSAKTVAAPLPKGPADFQLRDLRPDEVVVEAGHRVVVSWYAKKPDAGTAAYRLHHGLGDPGENVDHVMSKEYNLSRDTAFRLVGTYTPPPPGEKIEVVLTTLVSVAHPWMTAHDLSAGLTVAMQDLAGNGGGGVPGYSREKTYTKQQKVQLTALTDGFLLITTDGFGQTTVAVAADLTSADSTLNILHGTSSYENTLTLPVPVAHTVHIAAIPDNEGKEYLLALYWHPLGKGALKPSGS
ncbi:hypothetical protein ACWEPC_20740 [Nonomuraea sp. NPDC004297]